MVKFSVLCITLFLSNPILSSFAAPADDLETIIKSPHRAASEPRDKFRHPLETLKFFDIQPQHTVVEIWPGGQGWYTEILAPYLKAQGKFYAAQFDEDSGSDYFRTSRQNYLKQLKAQPELYDQVTVTSFDPPEVTTIAPAGSADRVLTFRNAHNWYMRGGGEERLLAAFKAFHLALKPGGMLGLVDHRLNPARPLEAQKDSGYMNEDYIISVAKKAGFELEAKAEINANPKDDSNHPRGVWTLPPSLRLGEKDKEHYMGIGESDRMTLKFVKPISN